MKWIRAMLEKYVLGPWRQRAQVEESRVNAINTSMDRLRASVTASERENDIYHATLADLRQRGVL